MLIGANDYGFADIVADVRDRLADVAVVVEELLPGRLEHRRDVLGRRTSARSPTTCAAPSTNVKQAMTQRRLRRRRRTRSSPRPTRRRCRRRAASATPRPASRARRSAAAASGTATPTGPATRSSTRSTTPIRNAVAGMAQRPGARHGRARSTGRKLCENTVGLLEEKGVANWRAPARSTRPSGCSRSAR